MKKLIFIFLFFFTILLVSTGCSNKPGKYDELAQCLTEKGAVMYGTEWCSHCQNQKALFGRSFKYLNFVDCDLDKNECLRNDVKGYPTWRINGNNYPGKQSIYKLSTLTKCGT